MINQVKKMKKKFNLSSIERIEMIRNACRMNAADVYCINIYIYLYI